MKIAIAQLNPIIGDINYNKNKIIGAIDYAVAVQAELVITPELSVCGYFPKDLLHHDAFHEEVDKALGDIHDYARKQNIGVVVGAVRRERGKQIRMYNTAFLLGTSIPTWQDKTLLPTYDVFDEYRYFTPAKIVQPLQFKGLNLGIHICEDSWYGMESESHYPYEQDPIELLCQHPVDILINISASPYQLNKAAVRRKMIDSHVRRYNIPYIYVNQIGGNDDLLFDGRSTVVSNGGRMLYELADFEEEIMAFESEELKHISVGTAFPINTDGSMAKEVVNITFDIRKVTEAKPRLEGMYALRKALAMGIKDYMYKTGFKKAVIGLSGGIDSAVVAALAVDALGAENVVGVGMPSRYSSTHSISDAEDLAKALGIEFRLKPIGNIHSAYEESLGKEYMTGIAEENIQARIRGAELMAISNQENRLLLTTGNKSEMSVGYCTLYGDMCGGLAVIADVPKTMVYELSKYINTTEQKEVIPWNTINKAPSAELRPEQRDSDSLPPYEILDGILRLAIEDYKSINEIVACGYDEKDVTKILNLIQKNEYKRRQAPLALKVTSKAFGFGRRYNIAQHWTL